jgi:hypothetical protein
MEFQKFRSEQQKGSFAMDLEQEFQKHASDCELMAKLTRDAESKAHWRQLAQRFRQCAERTNLPPPDRRSRAARRELVI